MTRTLRALGLEVDLGTHPWRYPGPAAPWSGLLADGSFQRLRHTGDAWVDDDDDPLDLLLRRAGTLETTDRTAVVAIGSNASPGVVHRKLERLGTSTTVPLLGGLLHDVAVGHLPHVNPSGYVAGTPLASPGGRTPVVVALLTPEQAAALDETEPRYVRRTGTGPLDVPGGQVAWSLYVSRIGAIAAGDAPLLLGTQADLWRRLRTDPAVHALAGGGDHRHVARRLAADGSLRERLRDHLRETWTTSTGLEHLTAPGAPPSAP